MANLSLREVNQSQLESAPIVDGQLIVCKDTGNMYRDFGKTRIQAGRDIEFVAELPLARHDWLYHDTGLGHYLWQYDRCYGKCSW